MPSMIFYNLRHAFRQLVRLPGFSITALAWVVTGLAIGVVLSMAADRLLRQSFASFGSGVVESLALSAISLLVVGVLAAFLPALRAASIEPIQALRNE
jgi:ABC-type antimicrobial peptide transport system permease subunit